MLYYNENGELEGKELYIIKELCKALEVNAQIHVCEEYEAMFQALENGEGNVIISAIEYTPERAEDFLLSEPYSRTTFGVYERKF